MGFRGACTSDRDGATSGNNTTVTLTFPSGAAAGDAISCAVDINSGSATVVATAGAGNTWPASLGPITESNVIRAYFFNRVLTSTDIAAGAVTFTWSTSGRPQAMGNVFSGVDQAEPFGTAASTQAASSSLSHPTVTTTVDGSDICSLVTTRRAGVPAPTVTYPGVWTKDGTSASAYASGANMNAVAAHYTTPGAAGSYGGGTITTSPAASHMVAYLVPVNAAATSNPQTATLGRALAAATGHLVVAAGDATGTLARATTAAAARALLGIPGAASRTLARATVTGTARQPTPGPGVASRALSRVTATETARLVATAPGTTARILGRALAVATGHLFAAAGDSTATLARAASTTSAHPLAAAPAPSGRSLVRALATAAGRPVDVTAVATVTVTRATTSAAAQGLQVAAGVASRTLGRTTLAATGHQVTTGGDSTTTLARATASTAARALQRTAGAASRTLGRATLAATGHQVTTGGDSTTTLARATVTTAPRTPLSAPGPVAWVLGRAGAIASASPLAVAGDVVTTLARATATFLAAALGVPSPPWPLVDDPGLELDARPVAVVLDSDAPTVELFAVDPATDLEPTPTLELT